ncbi:MAG: hypothetical protein JW860_11840 [Sedimentisphaerales bacterium]|nr:hypothetical protein [Sedimentisphaerales bacterium]
MAAAIVQGFLFGFSGFDIFLYLIFAAISTILIVPAIIAMAWLGEIEELLIGRGHPLPTKKPINQRIQYWALKMMFLFTAAVIINHYLRK